MKPIKNFVAASTMGGAEAQIAAQAKQNGEHAECSNNFVHMTAELYK